MYLDFAAANSVLHMYGHMEFQPTVRIMIVNIHLYSVFIVIKEKLRTRTKPTEGEGTQLDWLGSYWSVQLALSSRWCLTATEEQQNIRTQQVSM